MKRRYLAIVVLLVLGCGGGTVRDMRSAFEKGDYSEVVMLGRHAVHRGKANANVHYYYGLALVAEGRDGEGFNELDAAVRADAKLKPKAAQKLGELAERDRISSSDRARRLRKAHELDPSRDLGRDGFAVAATYYQDRDYEHAAATYTDVIQKFPDVPECERAYARLADCWRALGQDDKAREAMETLVKRFPQSREAMGAAASLNDILYQDAQRHFDAGEYDDAIASATELVDQANNRSLQQKGRFLLGQAYEAKGDRTAAYNAYRELIRSDRGDSGQIVERARARMVALQEAGLQ
ncbi:MAG TPA: tetratricopeptide repeat protein [Candidatus Krumholzibacteria bacterium]|nr:tetratricopeptide repeat protein [Candidatus Krumholzibacteria bacterium]